MVDVFTRERRSYVMSRIRSSGNKATELRLMLLFKMLGIRGWRRNYPIFGKPDFVFPKLKVVVFVDGVFWHGHPTLGHVPKSNRSYWLNKIKRNQRRDRLVNRTLRQNGWIVVRIWQNEITTPIATKKLKKVGLPDRRVEKRTVL